MQKEFKQAYFNITRHNPLPSNCMPITSKYKQNQSLTKLLQVNKTIIDMIDPAGLKTIRPQKRKSFDHFLNLDKKTQNSTDLPRRIHRNHGILTSTIQASTERKRFASHKFRQDKSLQSERRKDIYDDHIEKYMQSKYGSNNVIEEYLKNRDQFVKQACQDIKQQIKEEGSPLKKSTQKSRQKLSSKKLPKIDEIIPNNIRKSTHKIKNGDYMRSIQHLKKAENLDIKNRERKQRVFKRKIYSLEYRLDKIRGDSLI